MDRRDFLKSALASLALSGSALTRVSDGSSTGEALSFVFYDERFQTAEALSKAMAASGDVIPVRGDVTAVWNGVLKSVSRGSSLMLAGVTTESFYFCLKTLLHSHAGLDICTSRIDRDLIAWSLRSHRPISHGIS